MKDNAPFAELPDALVKEMLDGAETVGERVHRTVHELRIQREAVRESARASDLILKRADLDVVREPSVAGVDGSYQIHRLTSLDLCAAAAVAVEGTAKEERRFWKEPRHRLWMDAVKHADETTNAIRGVTVSMELELIGEAPHDLVLLDGSFTALIIWLNQAALAMESNGIPVELRDALDERLGTNERMGTAIASLFEVLRSDRVVGVPKYATSNELAKLLHVDAAVDGKTLATSFLEAGEYTKPLAVYEKAPAYHLHVYKQDDERAKELAALMKGVHVVYFRPYNWLPAVRLELTRSQVTDLHRRALVLEGIARQLFSPATFEPYPLLLADRMVKSLGAGVNAVETAVTQITVEKENEVEHTLQFLRQHRTEGGRTY